ncbi:carboxymuconolactone decarboxylase family protein [Rhizosphaericola mali]|uniref:ABM domain-containing protein n=1 Tax=Rhizosphaericola mali TaxID=2545455 RepID=A0A5P2G2T4_9BACT|nr:carboxymuconolactone decarboxylase family protein [Rhizosphaericola mali]QES88419.1 hypothetical protein E0W69_007015 [Rhizosphaericola mali]
MKTAKWRSHFLLILFLLIVQTMNAQNNTLSSAQQSLVKISSLTATGNLDDLKVKLNEGMDAGLTINEIKEALTQLYAYCGFPRSLNSLNTFKTVLDERKAKGISDIVGKEIIVENNVPNKYEQGIKVLEEITKTPQSKPAPGFGEFAPRIDAFLKEHLFADIFAVDVLTYQQRELVTISALASITGVEGQLKAHIGIGKNTGITDDQLAEAADIIQTTINKTQANTIRKIIGVSEVPVIDTDMIVRIAELDILPEYLKEYLQIMNENAALSLVKEKGVISIFPIASVDKPNQIQIVEIYANINAYESHLKTAHFQNYKTSTLKMIKSLKLIDMKALDPNKMMEIFTKLK